MRYFIVKNVYDITTLGESFESYHIIKAEDWVQATNMIKEYQIYEGEVPPDRSELFGEGTKEELQAVFFKGTPVYTKNKKKQLKMEYL
jgi:hypothetical protein